MEGAASIVAWAILDNFCSLSKQPGRSTALLAGVQDLFDCLCYRVVVLLLVHTHAGAVTMRGHERYTCPDATASMCVHCFLRIQCARSPLRPLSLAASRGCFGQRYQCHMRILHEMNAARGSCYNGIVGRNFSLVSNFPANLIFIPLDV